jgi:hypothetical protein
MEVAARLASVEAALADADADLSTDLGGHRETTRARLWRGQVLVDWEPDHTAGGCLLRPDLLRRLVALHAQIDTEADVLRITAPGRVVVALSPEHADLVSRLGGAHRVELRAVLRFDTENYLGGQETYYLLEHGQRAALLRLTAGVQPRIPSARIGSRHTSPAPM